ncbi:MAG: FAD-dependent oxidoreductase [Alphaproteobacteria bacterium]
MQRTVSIIGGGIIGLMSAWRLVQAGWGVTLYERGHCGSGATGAGLGGLVPFSHTKKHQLAVAQRRSLAAYPTCMAELAAASGLPTGYAVCERVQIYATPQQRAQAEREELSPEQHFLSDEEVHALVPHVGATPYGGLLCRTTAKVQPPLVVAALVAACRGAGVEIHENTPVDNLEKLTTNAVVVTAGAWSTPLVPSHSVKPVKGQAVLLQLDKPLFTQMIRRKEVYMIPEADGTVRIGSTAEPDAGFDVTPTPEARDKLWAEAVELIPALANAKLLKHWAGLRPQGAESWPLVTQVNARTFVAAGHHKIGLCLAPVVAEEVVAKLGLAFCK